MHNFVQDGNVVTLPATAVTGCKSGDVVAVGALIGVAATDAEAGAPVEVALVGVFDLPKGAGGISQGALVFWDGDVVTTDGSDTPLGIAILEAAAEAATVRVRLGVAVLVEAEAPPPG